MNMLKSSKKNTEKPELDLEQELSACLPNSDLGIAGFCSSTKSPTPTAFWAATRNRYSVPCVSLLAVSSSDVVSSTFVHAFLLVGRISTMYPVMGLPPSNSGGSHLSPAVLSVHPVIARFRGGSGFPAVSNNKTYLRPETGSQQIHLR